jgi:hypothetical protein
MIHTICALMFVSTYGRIDMISEKQLSNLEYLYGKMEKGINGTSDASSVFDDLKSILPDIIKDLRDNIDHKNIIEAIKRVNTEVAGLRKHLGMIAHE